MVVIDLTGKIKASFRKIGKDMKELKSSVNEWVLFLNSNQRGLKQRVYELERKVRMLEAQTKKIYR